jgi:Pyridoxamine 5'-phosphate oxidase
MDVAGNVRDMVGAAGMLGWRDMEVGAPEIARLGMARLNAAHVAMLGTLRPDGSPRISPIEPYLVNSRLLVGAITWSGKTADLRRDPRYVLHSMVTGPDSGEGELKLQGLAAEASPALRSAVGAWWSAQPPERAVVFILGIERALFVEWDIEHGVMTIHRWSPREGYSHSARTYP